MYIGQAKLCVAKKKKGCRNKETLIHIGLEFIRTNILVFLLIMAFHLNYSSGIN